MVALIGGWSTIGSAQLLTEAHDPVRGVHLSSIEVSNRPLINSWRVTEGDFSDIDRITIGLGAAVFDETTTVTEYTLWIAYEGRRWHGFDPERMLRLTIDGSTSIMELIRRPQPSIVGGRMTDDGEVRVQDPEGPARRTPARNRSVTHDHFREWDSHEATAFRRKGVAKRLQKSS